MSSWKQALDLYWSVGSEKQLEARKGKIPKKGTRDYDMVKKYQTRIDKGQEPLKSKVVIRNEMGEVSTEIIRRVPDNKKRFTRTFRADQRQETQPLAKNQMELIIPGLTDKKTLKGRTVFEILQQQPAPQPQHNITVNIPQPVSSLSIPTPQAKSAYSETVKQITPAQSSGSKKVLVLSADGKTWIKRTPEYVVLHKVDPKKMREYTDDYSLAEMNQKLQEHIDKKEKGKNATAVKVLEAPLKKTKKQLKKEAEEAKNKAKKEAEAETLAKSLIKTEDEEEHFFSSDEVPTGEGLYGGKMKQVKELQKKYPRKTAKEGLESTAELDEYHKFMNRKPARIVSVRARGTDDDDNEIYKKSLQKDVETARLQQAKKRGKVLLPTPETFNALKMKT